MTSGDRAQTEVRAGVPSEATGGAILEINNLEVIYDKVILVLRGLSIEVAEGTVVALLGSNGAGKSTLLKAATGLLPTERGEITDGSIRFAGKDITHLDAAERVRLGISLCMEGRHVFEHLTVHQNLIAGGYTKRIRRRDLDEVYAFLPRLAAVSNKVAGYLSGGEQQMLAVGRALMAKPRLLMLDEPSLGLAPLLVDEILGHARRLNNEFGTTVLLVEQNATRALEIADHGYILEQGKIVLEGPAAELRENPDVKEFYLGVGEEGRKSYHQVKHYRRRKRWL